MTKRTGRRWVSALVDQLPGEIWKPIPGYEGLYSVSSLGRVRGEGAGPYRKLGVKKATATKLGYQLARLTSTPGNSRNIFIHRLVLLAFCGPCPDGQEVRHLDGDPGNNNLANLRYGTSSENGHDTVRHGNHHKRRLTHCVRGHEFNAENTAWVDGGTHRRCLTCHRGGERKPPRPLINLGHSCSVGDCEKPAHSRGLCHMHYQRERLARLAGSPVDALGSANEDTSAA